jgi:hypothetical protein
MDENLEFKHIIANAAISQGTVNNMMLMPYGKDLTYSNGQLSMVLEFINENTETEIGINIQISEDLVLMFDKLLQGDVV